MIKQSLLSSIMFLVLYGDTRVLFHLLGGRRTRKIVSIFLSQPQEQTSPTQSSLALLNALYDEPIFCEQKETIDEAMTALCRGWSLR